ncbi:MAG TPA: XRE family transcriptional regulator [Longimicrobium sp.]|jgi:hypothetical protein
MMNDVENLRERLNARFPTATLTLDTAETDTGSWWLDVELKGHLVVVEWRPTRGFGVSTPASDDYGAGADEIYPDVESAFARIRSLLLGRLRTSAAKELSLGAVRESRRLSQVEVARRMEINQGALSRMEHRRDMLVGTLRSAIEAMGGQLELRAEFEDGTFRITLEEEADADGSEPGHAVSGEAR